MQYMKAKQLATGMLVAVLLLSGLRNLPGRNGPGSLQQCTNLVERSR